MPPLSPQMKEVKDLEEQAKVLMAHLPSKQSAAASNAQLGQLWRAAGRPAQRTGRVTEEATRLASSQNEQPLAIQHVRPLGEAAADAGTVWYRQHATALHGSGADDPFALISDTEYEASAAQYQAAKKAGLPIGEPPLNVEQRAGARLFLKAALLRAQGIQRGDGAQQIAQAIKSAGCPQVLLVVGAGGTGKSAMVHALKSEMQKRGAGHLCVTAYTGVASAPFGGPTLLALMSLSITCKNARDAKQLSDVAVAAARAKFASECGVSLDDIGGIVIDEVSFITAAVFGHVDHMLRVRRPMVAPMQSKSTHTHPCSPMPTHAHPCSPIMLTHAHSCSPMLTYAHPYTPAPGGDGQLARAMRRDPNLAKRRQPSKVSLARALHKHCQAEPSHKLRLGWCLPCFVQTATGRQLLVQGAGGEPLGCGCQEQAWRRGRGRRHLQRSGVRHQAAEERTQGGVGEAHASRRGARHGWRRTAHLSHNLLKRLRTSAGTGFAVHPSAAAHARYGYDAATNLSHLSERAATPLHGGRCERPRVEICARGSACVPVTSRDRPCPHVTTHATITDVTARGLPSSPGGLAAREGHCERGAARAIRTRIRPAALSLEAVPLGRAAKR